MQRIAIILILVNGALGRVLVDNTHDVLDLGTFLQYNGLNFSLNGNVGGTERRYCEEAGSCASDILPQEVEDRIYNLVHNTTLSTEEAKRINNFPKEKTSFVQNSEVAKPRKKRFITGLIVGIVGCMILCRKGGGSSGPVVDPYAKDRFLLEKERTKMEAIQFCYNSCADEWSQWSSCNKQCGSGIQTRTRELSESPSCVQKWQEYDLGDFVCPYTRMENRTCNEFCPNGGEPNAIGCTCFDGWGGTCCERKLYCPYPGQPANGNTILTTSPSPVGSIIMYSCDPGYSLDTNGATYSLCQQNQQWNTPVPSCNHITCTTPAMTQHLEVLNPKQNYNFGETIHFKCTQGYLLQGPESRKCQDSSDGSGQWSLYTPYCIAVECPAPTQADIVNGFVQGADYSYQATITFDCHDGYELIGLSSLTCTKHSRWSGFYPTCNEITCSPPYPPVNGDMQIFGTNTVVFSCQEGYRLTDDTLRVAVCDDNGQWDKPTPTCQAIECDGSLIENVGNGYVNGGVYRFPFSVKFGCYPGYVLQGLDEISCQETGVWSGAAPTCRPCPINTYMEEWSTGGVCTECPANTHTATEGSTNRQQCLCDHGFSGPNGGPCQEVKCILPNVPIHGTRGTCDLNVGQTCSFTCTTGHIPSAGSSEIECLPNGDWSNDPLSCSACPADTYNPTDQPNICLPCPEHMSTQGHTGQGLNGCVCTMGWEDPSQPGDACEDIDECALLTGGLACEDTCTNLPGTFRCECTRPGTVLNADGQTCDVVDSCRNLTAADAPSNGALVCTHNVEESSKYCAARCNAGFEFAGDTPNSYDTCDSSTQFNWPFESHLLSPGMNPSDARIADCIPEFFPGFQLNAEIFYLSAACTDLTPEQHVEVKNAFVGVLQNGNVCSRSPLSCAIENVNIICGARKKRDIDGNLKESVDFNFNVTFGKIRDQLHKANCDSVVCPTFRVPARMCKQYCGYVIKNYAKALVRYAKYKLRVLTGNMERIRFNIFNEDFQPEQVRMNDDNTACARSGQQYIPANGTKDDYCVSCRGGQYLNDAGVCEACPVGTHQLLPEQTSCPPCPLGSYSEVGWSYCLACEDGFYGENCGHQCTCVHGKCDTQTGECSCDPGWEGPNCSVDIDRCASVACPTGQTCQDRHPPQDGFDCV